MNEFSEIDALIPARGGSKRLKNKNMIKLADHPMIHWTIQAAKKAGIFKNIIVSTDDFQIKRFCNRFVTIVERPPELAADDSPDVDWIKHYMENYKHADHFMILRPTSPFRTAQSIVAAWEAFRQDGYADSLKSVIEAKVPPAKMSTVHKNRLIPLINYPSINGQDPWNMPSQLLPKVFERNPCIEIGIENNVIARNTVSGREVMPFYMDRIEAHDINTQDDLFLAEKYIEKGIVKL
jgi:CMP-N,N'-diacetyllegionaminic acid synthase